MSTKFKDGSETISAVINEDAQKAIHKDTYNEKIRLIQKELDDLLRARNMSFNKAKATLHDYLVALDDAENTRILDIVRSTQMDINGAARVGESLISYESYEN